MKEDKKQPVKSPKTEKLTEKELKHLMGMDRQTYKRSHGAIRNK